MSYDNDDEQCGIMIDSPDTRDRDDAIWLRPNESGVDIWVHVADVARHLPVGSLGDRQARDRVHTRYLPHRVINMLPNGVEAAAALRPDTTQPTMTVSVRLDATLEPCEVTVSRGRLVNPHPLSYSEVTHILADGDHRLHRRLTQARELAQALLNRRRRNGALAFYDLYRGYATTEEGNVIRLADNQRHIGYLIVQEFMIAANAAVARWAAQRDLPILYRNHRTSAVAGDVSAILDDLVAAQSRGDATGYELLRDRLSVVQRAAEYGTAVLGHHGLNLPTYTHATSPLRRYSDLVNQRMLLAVSDGAPWPYSLDELIAYAGEINDRFQRDRQRRAERHRAAAKQAIRHKLDATTYRDLTDGDFGKVLRMAIAGGGAPGELIEETRRRAGEGRLSIRDRYVLLLNASADSWKDVRRQVHRQVAEEPSDALAVLNMYAQADTGSPGGTGRLDWQVDTVGTAHRPHFRAQVTVTKADRAVVSVPRVAGSKKDAKSQAALALVGSLSGLGDLSTDVPLPEPVARTRTPRVPAERNAMMAVNEYAQTGVITAPVWTFQREGPPHEPVFTATVAATFVSTEEPLNAEARAGSKQSAKAVAAENLRAHIEDGLDRLDDRNTSLDGLP